MAALLARRMRERGNVLVTTPPHPDDPEAEPGPDNAVPSAPQPGLADNSNNSKGDDRGVNGNNDDNIVALPVAAPIPPESEAAQESEDDAEPPAAAVISRLGAIRRFLEGLF